MKKRDLLSYEDLCKIEKMFSDLSMGTVFVKLAFATPGAITNILIILFLLMESAFFIKKQTISNNVNKEILKLYRQFIKNYSELNKKLGYTNPIEIATMYNYALTNGYLSHNHKFKYQKEIDNGSKALGAYTLTGGGVCRHMASTLKDIFVELNIESIALSVLSDTTEYDIKEIRKPKKTKEELLEWIEKNVASREYYELLTKLVNTKYDKEPFKIVQLNKERLKFVGNHAITFVHHEGHNYYFDPTNDQIFRMNPENNKELYNDHMRRMKIQSLFFHKIINSRIVEKDKQKVSLIAKKIKEKYPEIPLEEEKQIVERVLKECQDNQEIFEQFYKDNSELYDEISNNILLLKK